MGLDMYLSKKLYIKNWDYMDEPRSVMTLKVRNNEGEEIEIPTDSATQVEFEAIYWRKANAIHGWFVDNVQNGTDDCGYYYVPPEHLHKLRDLCREVLQVAEISDGQPVQNGTLYNAENPQGQPQFTQGRAVLNGSEIAQILPARSGFFFGGTDYDEWYLQDIEYTEKELTNLLESMEKDQERGIYYDIYYHSSW